MASSNFQTWDAPQVNMENDAQYSADALRLNGAPTGAICPSPLFNKFALQTSVFAAAFGEMMAAKGYTVSDANQAALAAALANIVTNADIKPNAIQVAYSPTPVFDCSVANGFDINLAGNVTSSTLANPVAFQVYTLQIYNPSGYSFMWPTNVFGGYTPIAGTPFSHNVQQFLALNDGNLYSITSMLDEIVSDLVSDIGAINTAINALQSDKQNNLGFTPVQQGGGAGQTNDKVFIGWDMTNLKAQVNGVDLGEFVFETTPGTFTLPGGSLSSGAQTTYDTGIAFDADQVCVANITGGSPNFTLTYEVLLTGSTIKVLVSNTSSSTITYGGLDYVYKLI